MIRFIFAIGVFFCIVVFLIWYWFFKSEEVVQIDVTTSFPVASELINTTPGSSSLQIRGQGNQVVTFSFPRQEEARDLGDGSYLFNPQTTEDFSILYYELDQAATILLYAEPLGEVRAQAETYLQLLIPEDKEVLCDLEIVVYTNKFVSPVFANQDLGLSFCPGSIEL